MVEGIRGGREGRGVGGAGWSGEKLGEQEEGKRGSEKIRGGGYGFPKIDFFSFVTKRNFVEISFCQGHVSFRFGEISSKNSAKQNETKFLLHISIYTYMYIYAYMCEKRVYVNTCTSCMSILHVFP
jgi:hypothetical protein